MISRVINKAKRITKRLAILIGASPKHKTKHNYEKWLRKAQLGELQFHLNNQWRQSDDFMNQTIALFDYFGFTRKEYEGKTIIDLGAGSKLRTKYFLGANIIVIEPLADKFLKEIDWCDLSDASEIYSKPAEEQLPQCLNRADLVISINVLDHCFDFETIIENIAAYLKPNGLAFLSFDKNYVADEMHPLQLDESICERIFLEKGFVIETFSKGANGILQFYGHGPYCMNYRLKKVQQGVTADS